MLDGGGAIHATGTYCGNRGAAGAAPRDFRSQPGNDRSLADFTSATIDQNGCPIFTFAGNPDGKKNDNAHPNGGTFNFVTRQTSGCFPLPEASLPQSGTRDARIAVPNTGAGVPAGLGASLALLGCLAVGARRRRRSG